MTMYLPTNIHMNVMSATQPICLLTQHPPDNLYNIFSIIDGEFKTWFNENAPVNLCTPPLFHFRQVQHTTAAAPTTPTVSNTATSSQQMDQRRQVQALSPLDATPSMSIFKERL